MLILSDPIQLNSLSHIIAANDSFYERMTSNYSQMNVQITAGDLLHIAVSDPEIIAGGEGVTNLMSENNIYNNDSIKLDVINNVVNRIALSESAELTYQDRTYITSVLNKLGITDVQQFIDEVRELKAHTDNLNELIFSYYEAGDVLKLIRENSEVIREREVIHENENESRASDIYLHDDIYERLDTKNIYSSMQSYYRKYESQYNNISSEEMRFADYYRLANTILLSEMKDSVYHMENVTLQHHFNSYEYGNLEELEARNPEHIVETRMAAAVLLNLIDSVYTSRINEITNNPGIWMHIENALNDTTENTLSRFNFYHTQQKTYFDGRADYLTRINNEMRNEMNAISTISDSYEQKLMHLESNEEFTAEEIEYFVNEILEDETNILADVIEQTNLSPTVMELVNRVKNRTESSLYESLVNNVTQVFEERAEARKEAELNLPTQAVIGRPVETDTKAETSEGLTLTQLERVDAEEDREGTEIIEGDTYKTYLDEINRQNIEKYQRTQTEQIKTTVQLNNNSIEADLAKTRQVSMEALKDQDAVKKMIAEMSSQEEKADNKLQQILQSLDPETRTIYEKLVRYQDRKATSSDKSGEAAIVTGVGDEPGIQETPARMLHPEAEGEEPQVISSEKEVITLSPQMQRIYDTIKKQQEDKKQKESPEAEGGEIVRVDHDNTIELVQTGKTVSEQQPQEEEQRNPSLETASETIIEKQIYETLLKYQEPQGIQEAEPLFIPVSTAQFNADISRIEKINTVHEKETVTKEHEEITRQVEKQVSKQLAPKKAGRSMTGEVDESYRNMSFVHRITENEFDEEELKNLIESRNTVKTENVESYVVNNDTIKRSEINSITNDIVEKTTKQITKTMTNDINSQIAEISDQVYQKLEKRLKSERSRRGF